MKQKFTEFDLNEIIKNGRRRYLQTVIKEAINNGQTEDDLYCDASLGHIRSLGQAWDELKSL